MSPELIGILAVGVAIVAVVFTAMQRTDKRIEALETRIDKRMDGLEGRLKGLETRIASLEKGQARLEGLLDGLREALFERASR